MAATGLVTMIGIASSATAITICSRTLMVITETVAPAAAQVAALAQGVAATAWLSAVMIASADRIIRVLREQQREAEVQGFVEAVTRADAIAEADNVHSLPAPAERSP